MPRGKRWSSLELWFVTLCILYQHYLVTICYDPWLRSLLFINIHIEHEASAMVVFKSRQPPIDCKFRLLLSTLTKAKLLSANRAH